MTHPLHPMYYTDDYPREGCVLAIDVQADGTFLLGVFPPCHETRIESYHARSLDHLLALIKRWRERPVSPAPGPMSPCTTG